MTQGEKTFQEALINHISIRIQELRAQTEDYEQKRAQLMQQHEVHAWYLPTTGIEYTIKGSDRHNEILEKFPDLAAQRHVDDYSGNP